jgi:hypothetical protein
MTSSRIKPATFLFAAQCLKHYATACPGIFIMVTVYLRQIQSRSTSFHLLLSYPVEELWKSSKFNVECKLSF